MTAPHDPRHAGSRLLRRHVRGRARPVGFREPLVRAAEIRHQPGPAPGAAIPPCLRARLLGRRADRDAGPALRPGAGLRRRRRRGPGRREADPGPCRTSWSSSGSSRGTGRPGPSISSCSPSCCTTSATGTSGQILDRASGPCSPGGTLLAVHWRHPVADYPRSGDDVHRILGARPGLARLVRPRRAGLPGRDLHPHRRRARLGGPGGGPGVIEAIGVVVPAHDEEDLLPACLTALRRAARQVSVPVHVLVAADSCTDRTAAVARAQRRPGHPDRGPQRRRRPRGRDGRSCCG